MTTSQNSFLQKPLRLWPGVVIVILQLLLRFVLPVVKPEWMYIGIFAGLIGAILIVLWWLFFSRAPWSERLGAVALMIAAIFGTRYLVHVSIEKGAMGFLPYVLPVPIMGVAFVAWAVLTRNLSNRVRRVTMVATILLSCGWMLLLRTGGFSGDFDNDFAWRWSQTHEEKLLAKAKDEPIPPPPAKEPEKEISKQEPQSQPIAGSTPTPATPEMKVEPRAAWPGFRGPERNSIIRGVRLNTDWSASPPVEMWRREIGPGWSSFAVRGNLVYTQEQRGNHEVVSCYNKNTGKPVWRHRDTARFWESNAGAGPRGTPTVSNGRVYTLGATGILNVLDADNGKVIWSRNAASDTKAKMPGWGFSGSPLVWNNLVIVATSGQLAAYDLATGEPRWIGPKGGEDYSSPHLLTIDGVEQVVLLSGRGASCVDPATGKLLWDYKVKAGARIIQPAQISDGDLLITQGDATGLKRIMVERGTGGWTVKEGWSSNGLKPYFSDFVIHKGHAYGFDGSFVSCIDINTGEKKWKGGRYGSGQLVLLADQDLLLILSEKGELALAQAKPDQFTELAKVPAIESKTWNHPVLVDNILLVRNGEEMAAFKLALAGN